MATKTLPRDIPPGDLTPSQARNQHRDLAAEIAEHDRRYHGEDAPTISDAEYDALRRRLEALERAFPDLAGAAPASTTVGAAPSGAFAKVRHRVPMLSLGNAFSDAEVVEFVERVAAFPGPGD